MLSLATRQCFRTIERNKSAFLNIGRHNYPTVSNKCTFLQGFLHRNTSSPQKVLTLLFPIKLNIFVKKIVFYFLNNSLLV